MTRDSFEGIVRRRGNDTVRLWGLGGGMEPSSDQEEWRGRYGTGCVRGVSRPARKELDSGREDRLDDGGGLSSWIVETEEKKGGWRSGGKQQLISLSVCLVSSHSGRVGGGGEATGDGDDDNADQRRNATRPTRSPNQRDSSRSRRSPGLSLLSRSRSRSLCRGLCLSDCSLPLSSRPRRSDDEGRAKWSRRKGVLN